MLINGVLNMAIGLAMTFGAISLVTSAVIEAIATLTNLRSKTLLGGLKQLLNDPQAIGLLGDIYAHAAVNPLGNGKTDPATQGSFGKLRALLGHMPSYIEPNGFATALIDAIQNRDSAQGVVGATIALSDKVADPQLKGLIRGLETTAGTAAGKLHTEIATWFDGAMDRLSGTYKRRTQLIGFAVALAACLLLDVDAISIARHIYLDPAVIQHSLYHAEPAEALRSWEAMFPFTGWRQYLAESVPGAQFTTWTQLVAPGHWSLACVFALTLGLAGCLLTAAATLFGAPFWFDTLQRFVQLRGTGPEPGIDPTKPAPEMPAQPA
jgi:hypothetical protein